ncbi:diguanylate cyclase domain-containing protein [Azorhizophilus paspali]|uniref:Diguanylate cyclase domain-containing protein n=1 Tax=Azorhizophilus paspali TaxID=69963 RepID=A0ABV6SNT8_AZOPA
MALSTCRSQGAGERFPRWRICIRLALLLGLLYGAAPAIAGRQDEPVALRLDGSERSLDLRPHLQLLHDPGGQLQAEEVMAGGQAFAPATSGYDLNFGYTRDIVWLRLDLESRAKEVREWQIEFIYPSLDRIELFGLGEAPLLGGDRVPAEQRDSPHLSPAFSVRLAPGEQRSLFFRAQSSGTLTLDAQIWESAAFARHSRLTLMLQSGYIAMLAALCSYNLLLFFALRERNFLLYVLFAASLGGGMLAQSGLGAQYLWSDGSELDNRALPFFLGLALALGTLFTREFLDTRHALPRWHKLLGQACAVYFGMTLGSLLLPVDRALQTLSVISIVGILLLLACGLAGLLRRSPGARIFVLAELALMAGVVLMSLRNFTLLPSNLVTANSVQFGSALEMLLLSFGLAARLGELKRLKLEAREAVLRSQQEALRTLQEQERLLEQRVAERTAALAEANARLSAIALQDPLTGLANRIGLNQRLTQAWQRAQRKQELLALILIDLDGFKAINDRYGHAAGDQLLLQIAGRLQASARATDLVARLGGDEFVLVCEAIGSEEQAHALAERILHSLGQPVHLGDVQVSLSASIGISICRGQSHEKLLREADQAMYRAKAGGRSRIHRADSDPPPLDPAYRPG